MEAVIVSCRSYAVTYDFELEDLVETKLLLVSKLGGLEVLVEVKDVLV